MTVNSRPSAAIALGDHKCPKCMHCMLRPTMCINLNTILCGEIGAVYAALDQSRDSVRSVNGGMSNMDWIHAYTRSGDPHLLDLILLIYLILFP